MDALGRPPEGGAAQQWVLLWEDHFETWRPDNWDVQTGTGSQYGLQGWGNAELQHYTGQPENLRVEGGQLVITARLEEGSGRVTSARIRTCGRHAFCPSDEFPTLRIEAQIQVPRGKGCWPAFWMLPEEGPPSASGTGVYGGWAASGEIDIMEAINGMAKVTGSLHFGGPYPANVAVSGDSEAPIADGFHVYTLEWGREEMRWFLDGRCYFSARSRHSSGSGSGGGEGWYTAAPKAGPAAPFDRPFHLLLNLAIGGRMTGVFDEAVIAATLAEPKQMLVDYVRVLGSRVSTAPGPGPGGTSSVG